MEKNEEVSIDTLVNTLYNVGGLSHVITELGNKSFSVNPIQILNNKAIIIFYKNNVQLWEKWARQSRGIVLLNIDNVWKPIKFTFDRGAELLMPFHNKLGIFETENMTNQNISMFNNSQQQTIQKIASKSDCPGFLSSKVDGILVTITCYANSLSNTISQAIQNSTDEFAKQLLLIAKELDCNFIPVISTQKTFNVTDTNTISYILTSFLNALNIASYHDLKDLSIMSIVKIYGKQLLSKIKILFDNINLKEDYITFSFEAVCKNRTCYQGIKHEELAINYDTCIVRLLSYSYNLTTVPHFLFSEIIYKSGFAEPLYWKIEHSLEITEMLLNLSSIILGQMSEQEYLAIHKPSNQFSTTTHLDYEGFIFWSSFNSYLDYNKIKTVEYYIAHNSTNPDIKRLLQIAKSTTKFPFATRTLDFFNELANKLLSVCLSIQYALNIDYNTILNSLSNDAKKAYEKANKINQCKILMNNDTYYSICRKIFTSTFSDIAYITDQNINKTLKTLIDLIRPYESLDNIKENIHNIITDLGPVITKFYTTLQKYKGKSFVEFKAFNIFGDPFSTDTDIIVAITNRNDIDKEIDIEKLKDCLAKLGYDNTKPLDVNLVYIDDNCNIEWSEKGNIAETQNIVFATYHHHKQSYPCLIKRFLLTKIEDKVNATVKFVLDNLKVLIGISEYAIERENKRSAYLSISDRVDYVVSILHKIKYHDTLPWLSVIKSLTMKIIQLMLYDRSLVMVYTKNELALEFNKLYPDTLDSVLFLLFRGRRGSFDINTLNLLFDEFTKIITNNKPVDLSWSTLTIDTTSKSLDKLISEFIESPCKPTNEFIRLFESACPSRDINSMFHISCQNTHLLPKTIRENHCIEIEQRSPEWTSLLTYYLCGKNTGVIPYDGLHWVAFYYNLIRGSIVEMITIKTCDFRNIINEKYEKITVGLLVEQKNIKGSIAIAPDLLLYCEESKKIIPVEIKCLEGKPADNHSYRRAVSLASRQLETAMKILKVDVGIIVLVYVYFSNDKPIYDVKATKIDL